MYKNMFIKETSKERIYNVIINICLYLIFFLLLLLFSSDQMAVDQDWGSVWTGPRSFHPATVPLPLRQGYTKKNASPPDKYANAELMKIPNFLHLTPPVIKKQCEALKKFCTKWPQGLETEIKWKKHFPIDLITSDYCHGLPTIRSPLARIITIQVILFYTNSNIYKYYFNN